MIVNNARVLSDALNFEQKSSSLTYADKKNINDIEKLIKSTSQQEEKTNKALPFTKSEPSPFQTLATFAAHQKEVVRSMVGLSSESAIASALAGSIEAYGKQLAHIQGWTTGGLPMFESAMREMFEGFLKDGITGNEIEDLFQLAIMDYISHSADFPDLTPQMMEDMMHFLESTGSGSHGYHEGWNGQKFADKSTAIFDFMLKNAPKDSLCNEVLTFLKDKQGAPSALVDHFKNNFENKYSFIGDAGYPSDAGVSPMLRMALMAAYLNKYPDVTQDTINLFLTGSVGELNDFITKNTPGESYTSAMDFLFKNDGHGVGNGWREVEQNNHKVIDWNGVGLDAGYFKDMYTDFPPRELTDEDIKEINRIGDQVKMIQQTLKYWIQICRDELMAFARNI